MLDPLHQFHGLDDFNDGPNAPAAARCCTALSADLSHRTCTSFHSIADAAVVAMKPTPQRIYNVTGYAQSIYDIIGALQRVFGQADGIRRRVLPIWTPLTVDFDDSRARKDLGFVPSHLDRIALACVDAHTTASFQRK